MATKEDVITALETVIDPELNLDIWNMGLVYNVEVDESTVNIDLTLTSPMCPVGPMIMSNAKDAVTALDGVEETNIELVWDPPWDMEMMSDDLKFMLAVLNWASGHKLDGHAVLEANPWKSEVRRNQGWEMPKELSPHRPSNRR